MAIETKGSSSTVLVIIAVALIAFGFGWFVSTSDVQTSGDSPNAKAVADSDDGAQAGDSAQIPVGDSYFKGKASAPVTIIEFSSLQCPFCARGSATIKELVEKYPNDVRAVFKNFPLAFQAESRDAARAAMAAGEQGKFFEMKDMLFENMRNFRGANMKDLTAGYAEQLGLDVEKFKADFDRKDLDEKIAADMALGEKLGVRGTPHFFINGERVSGAQPLERFEEIVKKQLEQAKELQAAGVAKDQVYAKAVEANYNAPEAPPERKAPAAAAVEVHNVPVNADDYAKGDTKDPLVTIMEFSSFQCPFCARGSATIKQLMEKHPKNVRVVFKNFPLSFQQHSEPAARAFLAAGEQGKPWEMYDLLYENQRQLGQAGIFEKLAGEIGLNANKFKTDMEDPKIAERVKRSQAEGTSAGVRGTPAFLVNGIKLVGAKPLAEFEKIVNEQIEIAKKIKDEKKLSGNALYAAVVEHNKANAPKPSAAAPTPQAPPEPPARVEAGDLSVGNSYTKGPDNAPITIYEFSSFQCPFCARGAQTMKQVLEAYPGKIKFVYKNFPLAFQQHSEPAARAYLAAGEQGKAFEMYDVIYQNQRQLGQAGIFEKLAGDLGLNIDKFKKDMEDPKIAEQVKKDQAEGSKIGVRGTPAFFINGVRVVGAQPLDAFKKIIDEELAK